MAYKLKTTGLAASVRFLICVDPDTDYVMHYSPANVDGYVATKGANVTINSQAFDGITRKYWQRGSGTADADFVKFDTNKPNWSCNVAAQQRTVVYIGQHAASGGDAYTVLFGKDSGIRVTSYNPAAGGDSYPDAAWLGWENVVTGAQARPFSTKVIWGFRLTHGTSLHMFWDTDTGTSISESSHSPTWYAGTAANFDINYVNRYNTGGTSSGRSLDHAIIAFDTNLSTSDIATLRDDFFGVLLEAAGGGGGSAAGAASHYYRQLQG